MKINRQWHEAHKLPRNASMEERLNWHVMHAENCGCREMPDSIRRELEARGWTGPSVRSLK
ncbi:MAG: hypothetical protein EOP21_07430 [Hyphomicrobiales bacterium]|nr:MAG: hypothetical protein EOP21_07430 [Hyphomicrobiales bacterium]